MSTPPIKRPTCPLAEYWVNEQQTQQQDLISGAFQNPHVARKHLQRDASLQAQCDRMIDGGYRGTLSFKTDQREAVLQFAGCELDGDVLYRGLPCRFRDL